jgi:hypothetical protein
MTQTEALRLALEALEYRGTDSWRKRQPAITAIKAALEAKDEPVAWMCADASLINKGYARFSHVCMGEWKIPVYTTPPQRKPLTNEQLKAIVSDTVDGVTVSESVLFRCVARAIEAAHGIKGEA